MTNPFAKTSAQYTAATKDAAEPCAPDARLSLDKIPKDAADQRRHARGGLGAVLRRWNRRPRNARGLKLGGLEDRLLFSATPISPDMLVDGGVAVDEPVVTVEPDSAAAVDGGATADTVADALAVDDWGIVSGAADAYPLEDGAPLDAAIDAGAAGPGQFALQWDADAETDPTIDAGSLAGAPAEVDASAAATAGQEADQSVRHELVFVDTSTQDYQQLVDDLLANGGDTREFEVFLLDGSRDGIEQISEVLTAYDDLDAVHFVTHGTDAAVKLGGTWLELDDLDGYAGQIAGWQGALTSDADLLFYGCELAASEDGRTLIDGLSALTGADVAASTDDTGSASLGGDWTLEYTAGAIETEVAVSLEAQESWFGLLATETIRDEFTTGDYTGNVGTQSWTGAWLEVGEIDGPSAGEAQVIANELVISLTTGVGAVTREADLSGASSATVTFDYKRVNSDVSAGATITFSVSADGGASWTDLQTYTMPSSPGDATWTSASFDITPYLAANTQIRFAPVISGWGALHVDNVQILYTTVNNAPQLDLDANDSSGQTGSDFATTFTEDSGPVPIVDADAFLTDSDSSTLQSVTVTITNLPDGWAESLSANTAGTTIVATYNINAGVLMLTGNDTVAAYQQVLRTVQYNNTSDNPNVTNRSITFVANDGATDSNVGTTTLNVVATNDTPVLDLDADNSSGQPGMNFAATWTEGGGPITLADSDATLADVDSPNLQSLVVRIINLLDGPAESLTADTTGTSISASYDSTTGTLTLSGSDSLVNYQTVLRAVSYDSTSNTPNTTDRFITFVANDGATVSNTAFTTLAVVPTNDAPVAGADSVATDEDTPLVITAASLLANDTDAELDTLSITSFTQATSGTVVDNGDGTFTYSPNADFNGADSFTYTVADGNGGTDTGTVNVTVNPINDAPVAAADSVSTSEDTPLVISAASLLANDTDVDLDALSIASFTQPASGTVVDNGDGTFTYTPTTNFNGADSFTYTVTDGNGGTDTATVNITVTPVNDAPIAAADSVSTSEDTPLVISAASLLANDTDVDLDTLSIASFTQPANGTVLDNGDGTFTYTPTANYNGADSFTYTVSDGNGGTDTATVNITVTPVNDAPVATADSVSTSEDTPLVISAASLLANDTDVDLDTLTIASFTQPTSGTVVDNGDGTFTYTPTANFNGADSFTYTVSDGNGGTDTATVNITVNPVNDAPTVVSDAVRDEWTTSAFNNNDGSAPWIGDWVEVDDAGAGSGVGKIQISGGELSISGVALAGGPSLTREVDLSAASSATLSFDFRTTAGVEVVEDSIVLEISDNGGAGWTVLETFDGFAGVNSGTRSYDISAYVSSNTQIRFRVNAAYGGPNEFFVVDNVQIEYAAANVVTNEDSTYTFTLADFDFSDIEGDSLNKIQVTALESNGLLQSNGADVTLNQEISAADISAGNLKFIPLADANGTDYDSFQYKVHDGTEYSVKSYVMSVDVTPVNDAPVAVGDSVSTSEDTPLVISAASLLANDTDVDLDTLAISSFTQPGTGTVVDNGNGTFTYTPTANFNGADSFTYTVSDGSGGTDTATVNITVTPVNDAPVAAADSVSTNEDTPLVISAASLLANDTDVELDTLSISGFTQPASGTVLDNGDGTFTYTPTTNFNGADSFTYTVADGNGGTDTGTVNITVNPVNDAPVAVADSVSTSEDTPLVISAASLLANDTDVDLDTLAISSFTQPTSGAVVDNGDGTFTYTPTANFNGADSFTYTVSDGSGGTDTATVNITVTPVNDAPVAAADSVSTNEDTPLVISAASLLANDTDVELDTLSISSFTQPASGTVLDNGDGTFTYTPNADFNGADSFTYTVSDGNGGTDTATVNITVTPVNDAPIAAADSVSTSEDMPLVISAASLLANDTDVDLDTLAIASFTQPTSGTVVDNGNGTFTYSPNSNFNGADSFTYTVSDGNGGTDTATVNITVNPVNDAPVAAADSVSTSEDTPLVISAASLLANDTDVDLDTLTVTSFTQPTSGSVVDNSDGTFTYTPTANFNGADSFTYTVSDGSGGTDTATVNITVTPVNDAPVAAADSVSTSEDTPLVITAASLLANDTDADLDTLSITSFTQPASGTVVDNGDGTFTYTPNASYNGADSFTYTVSDGNGGTDTATVNITVTPLNDAPVAAADSVSTSEDTPLVISAASLLANDTDVDLDTLSIASVTQPTSGTVVDNGNGTFTYTPNANFNGADSFTYTVTDGNGGTDTATVSVTVTPVNDAPVAAADSVSTSEDTPLVINAASLLANDTDVELDTLSITSFTQSASGTVIDNGDGTFTYTPNADFNGADSFTYTVSDGNGGTDTATVNITVTPVNDAPVAAADSVLTNEDTPLVISAASLLANDTDVDLDTLSIASFTQPTSGTVVDNGDGTFTYTPTANFNGADSFTYTVSDGSGGTDTATVNITVTPVNDAPVAAADSVSTSEDTPLVISAASLLANDTDVELDTLSISGFTQPASGTVLDNGDGTFTYTPSADFNGADSFTYTVADGNGGTDTATVNITVTPVNDAPIAAADSVSTSEDTPLVISAASLLANDTDVDLNTLSVASFTQPTTGTVVDNGNGTFTYTPNSNFNGADSFTYTVADGNGGTDTATVNITVNPVNDAPVATADSVSTSEDTPLVIGAASLLANDTDVDLDTLTVTSFTQPTSGSVVDNGDGTFTYTPTANFNGADSFTYTVSDGSGGTDTATVNITVTPVNDAPVAAADSVSTNEDTPLVISAASLLANDTDVELDTLSISGFTQPTSGTVVDNGDGTFTYTPTANFNGADSFTYTVSDGNGGTDTATVNITVTPVNDAPIAAADSVSTSEDTPLVISAASLLANDTDVDLDTLSVASFTQPASGTVVDNGNGTFTYTPTANFNGADSFTYTVSDGSGGTDTTTVNITVTPVNDAPVAAADSVSTNEDTPLVISAASLLANDTDIELDTLSISGFTQPASGTVVDNGDGTFTYTPNADFNGADSFTYTVSDGNGGTDTATVDITVNPVNDAPVAAADSVSISEDMPLVISAASLLANDTDVDLDTLSITSFTQPASGTVVANGDGTFTYTPGGDFDGADSFTYTVTDGYAGTDTAVVAIGAAKRPSGYFAPPNGSQDDPNVAGPPSADEAPADEDNGSVDTTAENSASGQGEVPSLAQQGYRRQRAGLGGRREPTTAAAEQVMVSDSTPVSVRTDLEPPNPQVAIRTRSAALRPTSSATVQHHFTIDVGLLWEQLDSFREELASATSYFTVGVATATGTLTVLSVGYTAWTIRGGYLLSSLLSSLPAWRLMDPLPILGTFSDSAAAGKRDRDQDKNAGDDETLEKIVAPARAETPPAIQA